MDLTSLHPATIWALHKALTAARSATRVDMPVGDNDVDELVTLHVNGTTRCGDDYDQPIVAKADPWLLLAAALSHLNGVTVESLTREALTADPKLAASLKKRAKVAIAAVKGPTMTACKGKVTFPALAVSVVTAAEAAKAEAAKKAEESVA